MTVKEGQPGVKWKSLRVCGVGDGWEVGWRPGPRRAGPVGPQGLESQPGDRVGNPGAPVPADPSRDGRRSQRRRLSGPHA